MQKTSNFTRGLQSIGRELKFQWEQHGSKICTIGGTAALVGSGIHACRKTYKKYDYLKANGEKIKEARKHIEGEKRGTYIFRVAKTAAGCAGGTLVKYLPEIAGAAVGIYGVGKGWQTENRHYKEAAAFGTMIFADFMDYRRHVVNEYGEETDKRFMTTSADEGSAEVETVDENGEKAVEKVKNGGISLTKVPNFCRIWYSKETTPSLWSPSLAMRITNLKWVTNEIDRMLIDGHVSVNDIRRLFFGRKGDIGIGDIYGRIYDPGNPEHPEYGKLTNLHYKDDEDFMTGRTDCCWLTIDIDPEPIINRIGKKFTEVEV